MLNTSRSRSRCSKRRASSVDKKLIFFGAAYYYRGNYGQVVSNQKVGVYLDIQNTEANHLGMPLPKGTVRVYKADKSGAKQFIGEDAIDHTPRDEKVRIKMGEAFDVVGDRKQMKWTALGTCVSESDVGDLAPQSQGHRRRASRSTSPSAATGRSRKRAWRT